jgi:hypothetical protein
LSRKSPRIGGGVTRRLGRGPRHEPTLGLRDRRTPDGEHAPPRGEHAVDPRFSAASKASTDLQPEDNVPEAGRRERSQNLDADVGKPISHQKSSTASAPDLPLRPATGVQPSSSSPSKALRATLNGMPVSSASDAPESDSRDRNREPSPPRPGENPSETAGIRRGAKVRRRRRDAAAIASAPPVIPGAWATLLVLY